MRLKTEKWLLQAMVIAACMVPLVAGLEGMLSGAQFLGNGSINLDSHFRYLSGLLFGIGLGFLSTIRSIESQTMRFQLLTTIVVIGGFSRLMGVLTIGWPDSSMVFGLCMEILITPALCFWQNSYARRYSNRVFS
ncbi:MAG: DUF4345 domain-containing protein [Rickettsiales bacterium]